MAEVGKKVGNLGEGFIVAFYLLPVLSESNKLAIRQDLFSSAVLSHLEPRSLSRFVNYATAVIDRLECYGGFQSAIVGNVE